MAALEAQAATALQELLTQVAGVEQVRIRRTEAAATAAPAL